MKKCCKSIAGNRGDVFVTVCGPDLGLTQPPTQLLYFLRGTAV